MRLAEIVVHGGSDRSEGYDKTLLVYQGGFFGRKRETSCRRKCGRIIDLRQKSGRVV